MYRVTRGWGLTTMDKSKWSEWSKRFERITLYVVVLALALFVGYLTLTTDCRWKDGCGGTIEDDNPLAQLAEDVNAMAADIGQLTKIMPHVKESQAPIRWELERVAPDIADSVYARLREEGACLTSAGSCPSAAPASVAANFTFLYENARLNEARQITAESVGVRLAPRHERRLDLLESAFRPCRRDGEGVAFAVTGYSSTAEFQVETPAGDRRPLAESNELNLATANLRAKVVAIRLQQAGFEATPTEWKSFEALQRPYLDDSPPGDDQQALNRSVFIEVRDAGACDIGKLAPPDRS